MNKDELDIILEKSFRNEPNFQLSAYFAQKVTHSVVRREQWKSDLNEYFSLTAVLISLILVAIGFFYFIDKEYVFSAGSFILENLFPSIMIGIMVNFIIFVDRVLLPLLFNRWKLKI